MTTGWLLLLLLIVSSQSVDSQSTTDDETCGEGGLQSELQSFMERILRNQQQIFQRLGKYYFLQEAFRVPHLVSDATVSSKCIRADK